MTTDGTAEKVLIYTSSVEKTLKPYYNEWGRKILAEKHE